MKKAKHKIRRRIIALLNREEMEFVERLSMDSLFSTGSKLSRVDVIAALVNAAMKLDISGKGVKNKKELVERILSGAGVQQNRRKYCRVKKRLDIGFRKMDSFEKHRYSTTEDISLGGLMMDVSSSKKQLQVQQVIEITLKDPEEKDKDPIKAIGRIAWMCEKENDDGIQIGVMLTYIRKEDRERFNGYIRKEMEVNEEKQNNDEHK